MKLANLIFTFFLPIVIIGCESLNKQTTDGLIIVDVTKNHYAKKELILQDFMDVEYIALETRDDFYNQGFVTDIGKNIILVLNKKNDGDIFFYDRTGKALRKINRMGQGGEEYTYISNIILDEDNNEIYVHDHHGKKIIVYDLNGNFKRCLQYKKNTNGMLYSDIDNYDKKHLICFDEYNKERAFVLISKQNGNIAKRIEIPVKEKKFLMKFSINEVNKSMLAVSPDPYRTIIPFNDNKILLEYSADTIYTFLPDQTLHPFIARTPSVQCIEPEIILILRLLSNRYYFMETIKNEYNFDTNTGFSKNYIMYDKQEKSFFGYTVYNGDYIIKKEIYMNLLTPIDYENKSWQCLDAYQLVESYKNGELKGKLKEISAKLNEESNPVIMLIKNKK